MKPLITLSLLAFAIATLFMASCKKESTNSTGSAIVVTPSKNPYAPLVTIKLDSAFAMTGSELPITVQAIAKKKSKIVRIKLVDNYNTQSKTIVDSTLKDSNVVKIFYYSLYVPGNHKFTFTAYDSAGLYDSVVKTVNVKGKAIGADITGFTTDNAVNKGDRIMMYLDVNFTVPINRIQVSYTTNSSSTPVACYDTTTDTRGYKSFDFFGGTPLLVPKDTGTYTFTVTVTNNEGVAVTAVSITKVTSGFIEYKNIYLGGQTNASYNPALRCETGKTLSILSNSYGSSAEIVYVYDSFSTYGNTYTLTCPINSGYLSGFYPNVPSNSILETDYKSASTSLNYSAMNTYADIKNAYDNGSSGSLDFVTSFGQTNVVIPFLAGGLGGYYGLLKITKIVPGANGYIVFDMKIATN